ncbi:hypothetical protein TRAPUB_14291 [Trametes pubescens]|uniref:Uncharacterized protein n=1 Tax=Trametes pubescens TaxID=154538 RepID=A0A1M2VNW5_TRAPU|nr:hypothetical protein TRAPUB_14291 [Trametes pubescens]
MSDYERRKLRIARKLRKAEAKAGKWPLSTTPFSQQPEPEVQMAAGEAQQDFECPSQEQEQHHSDNHPSATIHLADDDHFTPDVLSIPVGLNAVSEPLQEPAPPPASWEDTYQHALNTSILSGRFEDLRIHSSETVGSYSYCDDSDLEHEDDTEDFEDQRNESTDVKGTHTATTPQTPPINPIMPESEETS